MKIAPRSYTEFLHRKVHAGGNHGFKPIWMPDFLFDFQRVLTEWALLRGASALFEDCGLGKTPQQLVWAQNVVEHTNGKVLIMAPLAVSAQTVREGEKFGIDVRRSSDGTAHEGITITNYHRLHHFDPADFAGAVCDESSILKSFDGALRGRITAFMRKLRYRLLCTATAAPNDYTELGTSSEALGGLGHMDMLNRFFVNNLNNSASGRFYGKEIKWRFRGHSEGPFWRWVCSWARAIRKPSDMGFGDGDFTLPPLRCVEYVVPSKAPRRGLMPRVARSLQEQREERRGSMRERCERVARLMEHKEPAIAWCHLNDEGDLLERLIPDAVQVAGRDPDEVKEERLLAFAAGQARVLVSKPTIAGWGMNFQHCAHVAFFPSHSFEQYYQALHRCQRYGQKREVRVDIVTTEGERGVLDNLQRKQAAADAMYAKLIALMNEGMGLNTARSEKSEEIPAWL